MPNDGHGGGPGSCWLRRRWWHWWPCLATFAWVQRQDARDAQTELPRKPGGATPRQSVRRGAVQRRRALAHLGEYAVRSTATLGYAVPEAIDAVHWALQEMGVQYDVTNDTPTAARFGPTGVHGVWVLPVDELMDLAARSTERTLSSDECRLYFGKDGCPEEPSVADVEYLGGEGAYSNAVAFDQAEVVVAISGDAAEWLQNLQGVGEQYGVRISGTESSDCAGRCRQNRHCPATSSWSTMSASFRTWPRSTRWSICAASSTKQPCSTTTGRISSPCRGSATVVCGPARPARSMERSSSLNSKSLVWTKEPEFTDLGYTAPSDWASFMQFGAADGR